ncbi:hypothetical protein [Dyella sp.]|jgi:hypothetical protein|uniref:hypothetical protein n=1 Tax=Dyella sp. TaxID=1869338 RepID=UPI002D779766|nr:hypothetical protein [Dyella sp.]HET6433896.1 hypothetical protein [Dyella sp.]
MSRQIALAVLIVVCAACSHRDLHGSVSRSPDGNAYLIVADDNGGQCGPLTVDGKLWAHPIGTPGQIEPGEHVIKCGGEISFSIPAQSIFKFDYWGP